MLDARIEVECQLTNPPKPIGFGVFLDGDRRVIAVLTYDKVKAALEKFDRLLETHERTFKCRSAG